MIIDPYALIQIFLSGISFEYMLVQLIRYLRNTSEKGFLVCAILGLQTLIFCLCEMYISQQTYPYLGELVTLIQHSNIALYPVSLILFWMVFLNDARLKTVLKIFGAWSFIQIITLFIPPLNIYGSFELKSFSSGTIFEINQWGFVETGIFGYTEIAYVLVAVGFILLYMYQNPSKGHEIRSEIRYFAYAIIVVFFALLNDLLVLWLEAYKMYFLIGFSLLGFIFSLNHFIVYKHKNLRRSLQETEEKFRTITKEISDGVGILINQKHYWINDAFADIFSYPKEEILGSGFELIKAHEDQDIVSKIMKCLKSEKEICFPLQAKKNNGEIITIQYVPKRINFEGKEAILVVVRDITDRIKTEYLIKQEIEKLKELDTMRKDLISRVSHELKTPITQIAGASEFLIDIFGPKMDNSAVDLLEMIQRGGKRLDKLVNRLIDVSRIEYNKLELNHEKVDLPDLVNKNLRDMKHLIKERDITLEVDLMDNLFVKIDRIRMSQVITNLISNAIKNTPPEGAIKVKLEEHSDNLYVIISDTGVGLTDREKKILFTRFGKIKRRSKGLEYLNIKGSGLGLYISQRIVNLHGGKIWAESKGRHKGSSFYIELPNKLKIE